MADLSQMTMVAEQCCAIEGFTRCTANTFQGWHLCEHHLKHPTECIVEEFAQYSPVEQTPEAANRMVRARRDFVEEYNHLEEGARHAAAALYDLERKGALTSLEKAWLEAERERKVKR